MIQQYCLYSMGTISQTCYLETLSFASTLPIFELSTQWIKPTLSERRIEFMHAVHHQLAIEEKVYLVFLDRIVRNISEGEGLDLRPFLSKKIGYLGRFFSAESWGEWTSRRTDLGKVVDLFLDVDMDPKRAVKKLSRKVIKQAEAESFEYFRLKVGLNLD